MRFSFQPDGRDVETMISTEDRGFAAAAGGL
jgi:hypothetical protein